MPPLKWSQPALSDVARLHAFLAPKSRDADRKKPMPGWPSSKRARTPLLLNATAEVVATRAVGCGPSPCVLSSQESGCRSEEADAWLAKLEAGKDAAPPKCHR